MKKNENTVTLKVKWKDLALFSAKIKDKQFVLHKLDHNWINRDFHFLQTNVRIMVYFQFRYSQNQHKKF